MEKRVGLRFVHRPLYTEGKERRDREAAGLITQGTSDGGSVQGAARGAARGPQRPPWGPGTYTVQMLLSQGCELRTAPAE